MQWLIDFLTSIWSLVKTLVGLIITMFQSIVMIFEMLPEYISYLTASIQVLPAFIFGFAFLIMSVTIILAIKKWIQS